MQDHDIDGCIFMGVAGSGKSAVAKAIAKHYGVVGMSYDIGASKSKYVGETGQHTRQVFRVVDAVTQGKVLMIATCNNMAVLPPEFRRRFTLGTFFFDSPPESAKKKIWKTYERKFEVGEGERPEDSGWTGAEIRQCCKLSAKMKGSKVEAGKYIVPVTISAKEQIDVLRNQATGKFISAAKSGVYNKDEIMIEAPVMRKVRKMNLKDIES
jgi:SpoVK/Ycf46/Vps4 family AAA+-type ATPase